MKTQLLTFTLALTLTFTKAQITFQKTFTGPDYGNGICVQQTNDGGYVVVGYTFDFGSNYYTDVYLIRTDETGDTLWTKVLGGDYEDPGWSVQAC